MSDGRVQRSVRSHEQIVSALIELVEAGELLPTAEQVATRAGVGLRTVFRHFEDMESLYEQISQRVERLARSLLEETRVEGTLEQRIDALVRRRANVFEKVAPFQRAQQLQRWGSAFLQERRAVMLRNLRADLQQCLPELKDVPAATQHMLDLLTSFEAWERLRTDQGLGKERAQQAVKDSVRVLLGSKPGLP